MNLTTSKTVQRRTGLALGLATLFAVSLGATAAPQADQASDPKLVGTWLVQVTPRNCSTNLPVAATFNSLVTFNDGGTVTESAGSLAFAPGQRSAGHGSWTRLPARSYAQQMIALLLFDTPANLPGTAGFDPSLPITPGFFAGWQTVSHTLRMTDDDHFASEGTNAFHRADGTVYRTGCSSAVSQRFK